MKNSHYTKAFEYTVAGYSVMPLRRNKLPLLNSWKQFQEKAADEDQIEAWWKQYPDANVGILTGKVSGITVVDIDMSGGKSVDLDMFPKTFTVKTPSGGYHLYYQYDPTIKQTANTFPQFPHVDIRNDGGYVVAPPSFCDYTKEKKRITGTYKVIFQVPLISFPKSLFIVGETKAPAMKNLLVGFKAMTEGDGRNVALTRMAGKILRLTEKKDWYTVGLPLLTSANLRFKKPLPDKEVSTIFNSIVSKEGQNPLRDVDLMCDQKGNPIANEKNVHAVASIDPSITTTLRFNIFTGLVETNFEHQTKEFEAFQRDDILRLRMYIMKQYPFLARVSHQTVEDIAIRIANEHRCSPPADWLRSLEWDRTPRVDTWLTHTYNVQANEYHKKVGSNWLKGLVKRIIFPGCKFDYVLVIEGEQGIKKSTSLKILGGDWHVETTLTPDNKDFFMLFAGKAIVEFSEGETLSRTEAKRLKAVITIQSDKYRVPYDKSPREFPRQCVFAMTTNQEEYLKDETGNRRWLPVACVGTIDTDWLEANREQLYAEAYHRVITLNETVYEFPAEETKAEQEKRQIKDPREDILYTWYFTILTRSQRDAGITTQDAYLQGLHKNEPFLKEMTKLDSMVIGSILRSSLKLEKRQTLRGNMRQYRYMPTEESEKMAPVELTDEMRANLEFRDHGNK